MYYHHWFIKGLKKIVSIENLVDSLTQRVGSHFLIMNIFLEFAAKIRTAQKVV